MRAVPSLSDLRRRGPSILRSRLLLALTLAGSERRAAWHRALAARPAGRRVLALVGRWWRRAPIEIGAGGLGHRLRLSTAFLEPQHVQAWGLARGALEPPVQEALRRRVAPGMTVFDVGANLGFFSLVAGRLVGPAGRVVAFEPVPSSAAAVRANAVLNGFHHVDVVEAAVGAAAERGSLLVVEEASWSHLAERGRHPSTRATIGVDVVALDELIESGRLPAPDVVKIDVEGSEGDVLRGMARTLARHRPELVIELHGTNAEVAELLEAAGYALENLDGTEPVREAGAVHVLACAAGTA